MRILLVALLLLIISTSLPAQQPPPGYEIKVTTNYKNSKLYLGDYYGKRKLLADSAMSDGNGLAIFKGDKKLGEGIYFIVSPHRVIMFEILMDYAQHFTVDYDSTKPGELKFTGSPDNDLFAAYSDFLTKISPQLTALQQEVKNAKSPADSLAATQELVKTAARLTNYRNDVITKQPKSMLATLLQVAKIPERPAIPIVNGKPDSLYPFYYVKNHYWDGVDFTSDVILHTPFFDSKLDDYFKYYVSPNPDSIISEVNYMLLASREAPDLHNYMLGKFTDKYINPEYMGQDKVFLFLFENFYSKGDTSWLNEKQRKYIFDRAYSLMANQINEKASPLELTDTSGTKTVSLYDIKAPLTFIAFWDPHCSHCKIQIPRLDSFYEAKWKNENVKILAVCVNDYVIDDWKKFIAEHKLNGWYHGYETKEKRLQLEQNNEADYRQLYDITQTPTFYLLDANKNILAKGLSLEQYDALIDAKLKGHTQ